MTEPEPAANPRAVTEEIERRLAALERESHAPFDFTHLIERIERLEALSQPAADRGQIVEECARVAENAALKSPGMLDNTSLQAVHNGACFEIAAAIRALSPAPAQTEE